MAGLYGLLTEEQRHLEKAARVADSMKDVRR
jgi:hypothetical protein